MAVAAAFAAVSESKDGKAVTNDEAGAVVQPTKMAGTTIGMTNAFFCAIGLLTRQDNGSFSVAPEVMAFFRAQHGLSPESAPEKLRPRFEKQWFFEALGPRLKLGAQEIETVIKVLGEASALEKIIFAGWNYSSSSDSARLGGAWQGRQSASCCSCLQSIGRWRAREDWPSWRGQCSSARARKIHPDTEPRENRRIVIHTPATATAAELKRIQQWLSFQLIVSMIRAPANELSSQ